MTYEIKRTDIETQQDPEAGFGVLQTDAGNNLPLKQLDVRSSITGLTSSTVVVQEFQNNLDQPVEATYIFPMPGRDAVTSFVMKVGDRTIDGVLREREQARQEYEQAIEQGHRAAIAEENRSETFSMRVGNIPAGETITIELTLVGPLPVAGGEATFRFPLVVAPRYISGQPLQGGSTGQGTKLDTDQVPDASHISPPVLLPGFPNPVQLSVQVEIDPMHDDVKSWLGHMRSTLHTVVVNEPKDGERIQIRLNPGERLDRDFILRFPVATGQQQCRFEFAPAQNDADGVFSLTLIPPAASVASYPPRDVYSC